ncbi:hypothetical protein KAM398_15820 [Acinetobacter sp. KAM398]|uniref:hypothetical protein n=1 Tax=Acinetobacter TaxID=469 RepID=UPI000375FEF1|nr:MULTISPECIES: hypothetical protein [unclassified Acinetobacter]GJC31525.1 hypothetical protein KAM392_15040 [Acinetobacter sp. KAM392]GJC34339.1 hypothetical protein KAM393_15080 [Acinetobacter sp. KAM393]GJC37167.1 hypothetical protein KAM394_15070 [Acinetobacter sp. KAM394]GJC39982.1 hypothetical protein KAM395_15030 [Acinetobacter sp. KAM395]GJC42893.1 hypothetical protein KAM396_15900 [Acinetobacter sp. KAM396]
MRFHLCACALVSSISISAFAEPPIQAGDTLESLSKVKISTTINGQTGSLQELIANDQIRIVSSADANLTSPIENMAQQPANQISAEQANRAQNHVPVTMPARTESELQHAAQAEQMNEQHIPAPSAPLLSSSADLPVNAGDDVDVTAEALNAAPPSPAAPEESTVNLPTTKQLETTAPAAQDADLKDNDLNHLQLNDTEQ